MVGLEMVVLGTVGVWMNKYYSTKHLNYEIYLCSGASRLPAVCGGRAPGEDQEAGQERQVDVHTYRQERQTIHLTSTGTKYVIFSFFSGHFLEYV
jgi:hypothetical protein